MIVAVGSLTGALVSARRPRATVGTLLVFGGVLAVLEVVAAAMPDELSFCAVLLVLGAVTLLLFTSANSSVQMTAHDGIRGRVMGVYLLVFIGSAALGGPLLGSIDQHFGPRFGMLIAGLVPGGVTVLIAAWLAYSGARRARLCAATGFTAPADLSGELADLTALDEPGEGEPLAPIG